MISFFPGSTSRLIFSCGFSFNLNYFLGGGVFESSPTCRMGNAESENFLILGGLFGPLVPCAYYFSLRYPSEEHLLGLYLSGPLVMLSIGGVIFYLTCSLPCSITYPLGTI